MQKEFKYLFHIQRRYSLLIYKSSRKEFRTVKQCLMKTNCNKLHSNGKSLLLFMYERSRGLLIAKQKKVF